MPRQLFVTRRLAQSGKQDKTFAGIDIQDDIHLPRGRVKLHVWF
jgi:hypothetical protein